ncbi:diguanylate cyclase [Sorangium cellulosum]|uniref:Diguanylate cyclase n=1 Tax=Sorangium cellulosum TaxID=56 RepID=A0A4P2Q961_SORCE|nr:DinB family protein [Sorangium cellulosum]AUX25791.1 diguanylate cyclase [Sorangium cellulosum]
MNQHDYVTLMAEYNAWMNRRMFEVCAGLSDDERKRDRGAFFGSIHGTLNHLMWADRAYLIRLGLLGSDLTIGRPGDVLFDDFEAMRAERERFDDLLLGWARDLEEGALSGTYALRSAVYRRARRIPMFVLIVQMFNHQTHHRGQITTLLSQAGLDIGSTDIPWMPHVDALATEEQPLTPAT